MKNEPLIQSIDGKPNEGNNAWAIYYTSKTNNADNGVSTKQWTPPDIRTLHPDDGCNITFKFQLRSNLGMIKFFHLTMDFNSLKVAEAARKTTKCIYKKWH